MALTMADKVDIKEIVSEAINGATKSIVSELTVVIDEKINELAASTKAGFDAVDERFDRLETEVKQISRVVRVHSADIAELKAQAS